MPIYEYQCAACGHTFDTIQKVSADPLRDCPQCQQPELKKLLSAPAFRLSGGGWYETDFKTGQKKNLVESGTTASATADAGASTSSAASASTPSTSSSGSAAAAG